MSNQPQTGDRVSYINDNLSGIVKRIIDKKQVLLLLDDGFEIPANISELIITKKFGDKDVEIESDPRVTIADSVDNSDRIYFGAITEETSGGLIVKTYLINTTSVLLKFAIYKSTDGYIKGIANGDIEPSRAMELSTFPMSEASEFRNMILQYLLFAEEPEKIISPTEISFKMKPVALFKEKSMLPVIKVQGFLMDLTSENQAKSIDSNGFNREQQKAAPVPDIVDLHLEELTDQPKKLTPAEAIQLQMRVFIQSLEKAMVQDLDDITFIHGVGKGILKNEIRRNLGSNVHIHGFADADPKKFGYGATIVYLKSR